MSVQAIQRTGDPTKLAVTWTVAGFSRGIIIQIASDVEMTKTSRTFLLPLISSCQLDTGTGNWYVRIGSLNGDLIQGSIQWSGIYGPWPVLSTKPVVPTPPSCFKIIHSKSVVGGIRIHTDPADRMFGIWEVSQNASFPASNTKWYYGIHSGEWYIRHLDPKQWFVRLRLIQIPIDLFEKPLNIITTMDQGVLGIDFKLYSLCGGQTIQGTPMKQPTLLSSSEKATNVADAAILHQTTITPNMRFSSYDDYMRYKSALEKSR